MIKPQTRSKSSLAKLLQNEDDVLPIDVRSRELSEQIVVDPGILVALREVFEGTNVIDDAEKVRKILAVRAEINQNWADARDSFLSIGRALLSLESTLSKTELQRLRLGNDKIFPFSDATATQFRQIARAVDSGRIPYEACPGSYGTAYQITLLDEHQLNVAKNRGLLRPDVTRREIALLRQESRKPKDHSGRVDTGELQDEAKRLRRREQQIQDELDQIQRRLQELDHLLGPD
jgi:hypothetical protein